MFIVWRVIVPLHQASLGVSRQSDGSPDTENPVAGASEVGGYGARSPGVAMPRLWCAVFGCLCSVLLH